MPSNEISQVQNGWLPQDPAVVVRWLSEKLVEVARYAQPFAEVIQQFKDFIENDASILALFEQMFDQIPDKPPFENDAWGKPLVRDYMTMLRLFNLVLTEAPVFVSEYDFIALPFTVILGHAMGTLAGKAVFQIPSVNEHFHNILNERGKYLSSPASAHVLHSEHGGWFATEALQAMGGFTNDFVHNSSEPHWGFTSWDNFFTRRFKENVRPVPTSYESRTITSPCESSVYNIEQGVQERSLFWIKGITYSLRHMLAHHEFVPKFVGGTVYQSFLSALSYHRWHSPVTGTVVDIDFVPGTYFASSLSSEMNLQGIITSQGYFPSVATRVNIYIEAENPQIGLICFMAVGMTEVSSCEVTVKKGDKVVQGQETGMFHFGGSTSCLIFRPETKIKFPNNVTINRKIKLHEIIGFVEAEGTVLVSA